MKNTFVWGFCYDIANIIQDLENKDIINIKGWIKDFKKPEKYQYDIFDFLTESWLNRYKEEIEYYTKGVIFNEDAYNKVYEKIYLFHDQFSRHDVIYQRNKLHYYINMFNSLYRFFWGLFEKEKIDLVLFSNIPHEGTELIIYEIAKFLGIKTIFFVQHSFLDKIYYLESVEDYGPFNYMYQQNNDSDIKIEKTFYKDHWYMKNIETYDFTFSEVIKNTLATRRGGKSIRKKFIGKVKAFCENFLKYLDVKQYLRNLENYATQVNYDEKFVYFPLHFQPELTTSVWGGIFCDQLLAIEILSEIIPEDWTIYVKDNPKQSEFMRPNIFFKRLSRIRKVKLTPITENTFKLIEKSQFVATITGTAAWESITGGKPALIFGNIWFETFPGIFKYNKDFKLEDLLNYKFEHKDLEKALNDLVNKMGNGLMDSSVLNKADKDYSATENINSISGLIQKLINKD